MRSSDGSITKVGPRAYRVRITVGYDPETGAQIRASRTVRGTAADAERVREHMTHEASGVTAYKYGKMPVADFVADEWMPSRKLRPTSIAGYTATIRNHIRPLFSSVTVEGLGPLFITRALAQIPAPGARLNTYKMLKSALNLAVDNDVIRKNPITKVAAPELEDYEADVYSLEEVIGALEAVRGQVIEPGILVAATCGLRASETCALDWSDVLLERLSDGAGETYRGAVDVHEGYHRVSGQRLTTPPKSKRSKRVVAIPGFAVARLLEIRGPARIGPLMVDATGQRMTPGGFAQRWRRLTQPRHNKAGAVIYEPPVRYIELKNLRHSQSTILLDLGATMHEVSLRDGHSRESTTDTFYNKTSRSVHADHSVAERMDEGVARARRASVSGLTRPKEA